MWNGNGAYSSVQPLLLSFSAKATVLTFSQALLNWQRLLTAQPKAIANSTILVKGLKL